MSIPVYIAHASGYRAEDLPEALDKILSPLTEKLGGAVGKRFMIKPNLLSYRREEDVSCTHPRIITGTAEWLIAHGAAEIAIIENPGTQDAPSIIRAMGISEELEKLGVKVANCARYAQLDLPPEAKCRRMELATEFLDFDAVVNIAKAKTHAMMTLTLGVKNLFGLVRGGERLAWHLAAGHSYARFADMLIDIALTVRPRLNLLDAVWCMEGNGPGNGDAVFRGIIAGAETPFALDAALAPVFGAPECPQLEQMRERGLLPETHFEGTLPERPQLRRPDRNNALDMSAYLPSGLGRFLRRALVSHPEVNPTRCIACGLCAKVCPPKTLKIRGKLPTFDLRTCIRCYCCQEHCPQGAITVHRTLMMKVVGRMENVLRRFAGAFARIKNAGRIKS